MQVMKRTEEVTLFNADSVPCVTLSYYETPRTCRAYGIAYSIETSDFVARFPETARQFDFSHESKHPTKEDADSIRNEYETRLALLRNFASQHKDYELTIKTESRSRTI